MATDVAKTVKNCAICAENRIHERKRTSLLKLFPASEPLELVSLDILGTLPKTEHGNRFLLVITHRFSKLTRTVPLRTISILVVAKAFCEHWVFVYGRPRYALIETVRNSLRNSFWPYAAGIDIQESKLPPDEHVHRPELARCLLTLVRASGDEKKTQTI
jgi:hypothetical protein